MRTLSAFLIASFFFVACQTSSTENGEVLNTDSIATQVDSTLVDTTSVVIDSTLVDSVQ